nr:PREDICTED: uncharacterized protein LOC103988584 [Musa acuminata subsp. malaccensis]XP_018682928.1 PREDICTED: uncharacterized protein LOC103988584 [Musa acuminata subsp. malaccensis]
MERSQIWFALRCLILALLLSWAVADDNVFVLRLWPMTMSSSSRKPTSRRRLANVFVLRFALECLILALLLSWAVADDNVFVLTEANFEKEVGQRLRPQVRPL